MKPPRKPDIAEHIASVRRRIEQIPVGPERSALEVRLGRVAADMARAIADKARRK
jgi:hypothetical protein